ncbi:type II secretion system minor pseudopilin GspJ [Chimaeribacter arupi]|uniref:type II secretion system minor pseudopilin GspJ n=1 Tax=Chimaeribacter arupi TaxID=2060066 RepID=UPI000C7A6708|nr:type II secretion system minor pseudopilin GspJ [Chimaeribacter arupi]PLR43450.1 type II secretion system protein GspJ [Chimaeribacter arupi]
MNRQKGFTLLETMLALFIFSMLSMLAYQILSGALKTNERTQSALQRINALHRTMNRLERDIVQSLPRVPRGAEQSWHQDDNSFALTTQSRPNTWGQCCSPDILRVTWQLKAGTLHRLVQRTVDAPDDSTPLDAPLLDNVDNMSLHFYQQGWKTEVDAGQAPPTGIEVTLTLKDFGVINRVFVLPASWPGYQDTESGDEASEGEQQSESENSQEGESSGGQEEPMADEQPLSPPAEDTPSGGSHE